MIKRIFAALFATTLLASFGAHAVPCGSGGVSPSTGCENGPSDGSNDSVGAVNGLNMFGFSDWAFIDKADPDLDPDFDSSIWTVTGLGNPSGTFDLVAGIWSAYSDLMVVLKGGKIDKDAPDIRWSGYKLPFGTLSYTWDYNGSEKEISHLTLYGREGKRPPPPTGLSEPATLGMVLLGFAIAGFVALRREPHAA